MARFAFSSVGYTGKHEERHKWRAEVKTPFLLGVLNLLILQCFCFPLFMALKNLQRHNRLALSRLLGRKKWKENGLSNLSTSAQKRLQILPKLYAFATFLLCFCCPCFVRICCAFVICLSYRFVALSFHALYGKMYGFNRFFPADSALQSETFPRFFSALTCHAAL